MKLLLPISLLFLLLITSPTPLSAQEDGIGPVSWEQIGEDLELAQVSVRVNALLSSEVLLLRTALSKYRVAVVQAADFGWKRNTVEALAKASKAKVAINANFFDEAGKPLGLIISRGIIAQPLHRGGGTLSGVFQVSSRGPQIVSRSNFEPQTITEAVQSGPRLISKEERVSGLRDLETLSRRAGVCVDRAGRLVVYCVSSGILGVTLDQVQDLLLKPAISCVDALNFDGGGSAQIFLDSNLPGSAPGLSEISVHGTDPVPVAVTLVQRDENP